MNAPTPDSNSQAPVAPAEAEADTSMEISEPAAANSAFLPITLLSLAFGVILLSNVGSLNARSDVLTKSIEQAKPVVQQAVQAQANLQKILSDVYEVAKEDEDAKLILFKYKVRDTNGKPLVNADAPKSAPSPSSSSVQ